MRRRLITYLLLVSALPIASMADAPLPKSGYEFMNEDARLMQDDDFENLGMLSVQAGRELFTKAGDSGDSCASCHGENGGRLDPKRIARYPVYSEQLHQPINLQQQINLCWTERLDNFPMPYDSREALELETFVRHLARGEQVNVQTDGRMAPYYAAGKVLFYKRIGQLDMACNFCHERNAGLRLRGQTLSQGQSNGFPVYRLATGRVTSLHRRFRECSISFRAEPFESGSSEYVNLEIFVAARGNGLRIETPAIRY